MKKKVWKSVFNTKWILKLKIFIIQKKITYKNELIKRPPPHLLIISIILQYRCEIASSPVEFPLRADWLVQGYHDRAPTSRGHVTYLLIIYMNLQKTIRCNGSKIPQNWITLPAECMNRNLLQRWNFSEYISLTIVGHLMKVELSEPLKSFSKFSRLTRVKGKIPIQKKYDVNKLTFGWLTYISHE